MPNAASRASSASSRVSSTPLRKTMPRAHPAVAALPCRRGSRKFGRVDESGRHGTSRGASRCTCSAISCAVATNTSASPPAGSITSSHGSSSTLARSSAAIRSANALPLGDPRSRREAFRVPCPRGQHGGAPGASSARVPRRGDHQVGGFDLASVACRLRWLWRLEPQCTNGVGGPPAHRQALDHVRARRGDHEVDAVFGEECARHHRTRRVSGAERNDVQRGHGSGRLGALGRRPESANPRRPTRRRGGERG